MSAPAVDADLLALPKAHLHVHLMGSVRPATLHELARRAGVDVSDPPARFADWASFFAVYGVTKSLVRHGDDLHRLVHEVVADAAADGAVRIEISVSPSGYRAITGSDRATLDLLDDAVGAAAVAAGIEAGLIISADRVRDADHGDDIARLAASKAGHGVVGFGLAGDEAAPATPFAAAAGIARAAGLQVVPHAGELGGPPSVRETLDALRPDRILHGVRAVEDAELVAELADRGLVLDVCPSSNVALGVVADLTAHPLPRLLRAGVRCSLNADNTYVMRTGLAVEYHRARHVLGLTDAEIAAVARTSLTA